ncbi:hypothetical protein HL658_04240 [Azospirillum sp. RWY-5-1]|uniref:YMGG-like Gly-zipper domain-containing protein n=1 Tax=Azospirillum oleiclasticum TaxID=2735135 RepID=A0ABX2T4Z3_9PROT|nr:YMGG-like glycine zipper-containing protein [Azospirillum oleiclasticum]NYZ11749.1 hypothetical protein [Azospirillum oleiclasticum]NYZ18910.1 hypothetical protein [Azospirillum oleiclasticum]
MFARVGKLSVVVLTVGSLALPGCVTTREDRIGANDGSDRCYAYRVALDSTGNYYAEDMLKGAAVGAVGGALVGGLAGGDLRGALIGAAVGAAVGAAGGYWNAKMQQGRDQAIVGTLADLQTENDNLKKTQAALDQLINCRRAEINTVKADYKAKRIAREEAEARMAVIRTQVKKDYEIASAINQNVTKRNEEYLFAADQVKPGSSQRIKTAAAATKKPTAPKPTKNTETAMLDQTMSNTVQKELINTQTQTVAGLEGEAVISG